MTKTFELKLTEKELEILRRGKIMRYLRTDTQENNKFLKITYRGAEYFVNGEAIIVVKKSLTLGGTSCKYVRVGIFTDKEPLYEGNYRIVEDKQEYKNLQEALLEIGISLGDME